LTRRHGFIAISRHPSRIRHPSNDAAIAQSTTSRQRGQQIFPPALRTSHGNVRHVKYGRYHAVRHSAWFVKSISDRTCTLLSPRLNGIHDQADIMHCGPIPITSRLITPTGASIRPSSNSSIPQVIWLVPESTTAPFPAVRPAASSKRM
jgi:hypothetical protein